MWSMLLFCTMGSLIFKGTASGVFQIFHMQDFCGISGYSQGRIERRGHATHTNTEIYVVTKIRFYAYADVTSHKVN